MTDILKINRAKWRTGWSSNNKTGIGTTKLLNEEGYMCCLGFRCLQLGVPKKKILGVLEPRLTLIDKENELIYGKGNSIFAHQAMKINDHPYLTPAEREKKITEHFATKGIKVVFIGRYKNQNNE